MVQYVPTFTKGTLSKKKKISEELQMMLMQYAMFSSFFFPLIFFIKAYVFGTYLVDTIQMGTQNIFLYKQVDRMYTGYNLKTTNCLTVPL